MNYKLITTIAFLFIINISNASVIILNGLTHSFSGVSGQTIQGEIILANTTNKEQRVSFDLNEAIYSCTSERVFLKTMPHANSSTNWFNGSIMEKVLAPKEKYIYKYSITIPNDATLKGSFWTTLMITIEKPFKEEVVNNIGLNSKIRYGVRLLTDVNSKDDVKLDFKNIDLNKQANNYNNEQLDIKIFNESIFIENVKLTLEVYDDKGNKILETATKRSKVFPEVCRNFTVDISTLPKGKYQCIVIADSREEFVGTNISLVIN